MNSKGMAIFFGIVSSLLAIGTIWSSSVVTGAAGSRSQEKPSLAWLEKWNAYHPRKVFLPAIIPLPPNVAPIPAPLKKSETRKLTKTAPADVVNNSTASEGEELEIGMLRVRSEPSGATVFVDNNDVGRTPIELDVLGGDHEVRVVHPAGEMERLREVSIKPGKTSSVEVKF